MHSIIQSRFIIAVVWFTRFSFPLASGSTFLNFSRREFSSPCKFHLFYKFVPSFLILCIMFLKCFYVEGLFSKCIILLLLLYRCDVFNFQLIRHLLAEICEIFLNCRYVYKFSWRLIISRLIKCHAFSSQNWKTLSLWDVQGKHWNFVLVWNRLKKTVWYE